MSACFLRRADWYSFDSREPVRTADKDVDAITLYGADWSRYLTGGRTITASSWIVESGDLLVGDGVATVNTSFGVRTVPAANFDPTRTAAWFYGGVAGRDTVITNRVLVSDGSVEDASLVIKTTQGR